MSARRSAGAITTACVTETEQPQRNADTFVAGTATSTVPSSRRATTRSSPTSRTHGGRTGASTQHPRLDRLPGLVTDLLRVGRERVARLEVGGRSNAPGSPTTTEPALDPIDPERALLAAVDVMPDDVPEAVAQEHAPRFELPAHGRGSRS